MELTDIKALVIGLGATGVATASFLVHRGARVTVTDAAPVDQLQENASRMRELGVNLELGGHSDKTFQAADLIVLSPGVPHELTPIARAQSAGIPVIGEIELASRFIKDPMVAVSGTNGKTTTTALIGDMLKCSQKIPFVGGNIGDPLIGYVDRQQRADVLVIEVSSFQLDTIQTFRPDIAVLLNVSEDHLDRYADFQAYVESKMRLFENQQPSDLAVIKGDDPNIYSYLERIRSRKLFFAPASSHLWKNGPAGAQIADQQIRLSSPSGGPGWVSADSSDPEPEFNRSAIRLPGRHNLENAAAASLAALAAGATVAGVRQALQTFEGLPHRLETVARLNGVSFVNDSKATNMGAVVQALASFDAPVTLILGGRNKEGHFEDLIDSVGRHVKHVVALGESKQQIMSALNGTAPIEKAASMQDAVSKAFTAAAPGDTVLLSPGCASFDQYGNYAERGEDFRRAVAKLKRQWLTDSVKRQARGLTDDPSSGR